MTLNILVIVPAFSAARYLPELITSLKAYIPIDRIMVVDDGSTDGSAALLGSLGCRWISFPENRGKGAALRAGFGYALDHGFEAVITIDADLQHPPEHLPDFMEKYDRADILIGTREIDLRIMPPERWLTNNLTSIIISIFGAMPVRDSQSGYRLIKSSVLRELKLTSRRYDTESELLFQAGYLGFTVAEVPVHTVYAGSRSFINPLVDTLRFIRQIWKRLWY